MDYKIRCLLLPENHENKNTCIAVMLIPVQPIT